MLFDQMVHMTKATGKWDVIGEVAKFRLGLRRKCTFFFLLYVIISFEVVISHGKFSLSRLFWRGINHLDLAS